MSALAGDPTAGLIAVVLTEQSVSSVPLPRTGKVVIGRSDECDVVIDDPSVSRRHLLLHLGDEVYVEDLGSANGTRVRDARVAPGTRVRVELEDVVMVGDASLVVQPRDSSRPARRLWMHDYFEARLEEECLRALRVDSHFAVIRVGFPAAIESSFALEHISSAVRAYDVIGAYGPHEFEILLADTTPDQAVTAIHRLRAALVPIASAVRIGLACRPADGRDVDSLLRASGRAMDEVAPPLTQPRTLEQADARMQHLHRMIERIAQSTINVLILGETGVGKEVMAERLHRKSPRAEQPFVRLNCAALSETLLESELFGHERGAFTGATSKKRGLLETAEGGTVFLDELGELPLSIQAKLLRVIEERRVLPVGGLKSTPIDVRLVAATNRDLEACIKSGLFREDLYFRLNGFSLVIPPLRQRPSELDGFISMFLSEACARLERPVEPQVSAEARALLRRYSWPGNIRELRNVIERAVVLATGDEILPEHLPVEKMRATFATSAVRRMDLERPSSATPARRAKNGTQPPGVALPAKAAAPAVGDEAIERAYRELETLEKQRIVAALAAAAGNQTEAARALGISRRTLLNRLDKYDLPRPRRRSPGD
ncbi:MAG TPA: sigma 54-interacting transcriptional regulator [Kofleriaceae bacterium]|nr:sigma 54-interacting transcriptional regulator [Kofleriaceae bacterium]